MFIIGAGSARPPNRFTQHDCWRALESAPQFSTLSSRSRAILKKVLLGETGIETRYLAFDRLEEAFALDPDTLHKRFVGAAPVIASEAAKRALNQSGKIPEDIDAMLISTC